MKLNDKAQIFIPDGKPIGEAIARTTHLAISAHQDDIEFMAYAPIAECFSKKDKWFTGVVTSDGAGSPRNGIYQNFTDEDMKAIRITEQKKAATVGEYGAQILLGHSSAQVKNPQDTEIISEYVQILKAARPQFVYIHNLADKHDPTSRPRLNVFSHFANSTKANFPKRCSVARCGAGSTGCATTKK